MSDVSSHIVRDYMADELCAVVDLYLSGRTSTDAAAACMLAIEQATAHLLHRVYRDRLRDHLALARAMTEHVNGVCGHILKMQQVRS